MSHPDRLPNYDTWKLRGPPEPVAECEFCGHRTSKYIECGTCEAIACEECSCDEGWDYKKCPKCIRNYLDNGKGRRKIMPEVDHVKQHREFLKYSFSLDELREHGLSLAREMQKLTRIREEKKQVTKDYDAQVAKGEAEVGSLSTKLNNGYEMRDTDCETRFHFPEKGTASVFRLDTGELVRERRMESWEMQEELPLAGNGGEDDKQWVDPEADA